MIVGRKTLVVMSLIIFFVSEAQAMPKWANEFTPSLRSNYFKTICSGQGPALDIARTEALNGCRNSVSEHLKTSFRVKSLTVETEKSTSFHQEVFSDQIFQGLKCNPLKEEMESLDSSSVKVWLLCEFNLKKAKVKSKEDENRIPNNKTNKGRLIINKGQMESIEPKNISTIKGTYIKSKKNRVLTISSIPKCSTIVIRGETPRSVICSSNPISLTILSGDKELIVRAVGFRPKSINLSGGGQYEDEIQIFLENN